MNQKGLTSAFLLIGISLITLIGVGLFVVTQLHSVQPQSVRQAESNLFIQPLSSIAPTPSPLKPRVSAIPAGYSNTKLHVKFKEDTAVRLRNGLFVTLASDDLSGLNTVISNYQGIQIQRLFTRLEEDLEQEKASIEVKSNEQQADLNLYYRLILPTNTDAVSIINALNDLAIVETAYPEPLAASPP